MILTFRDGIQVWEQYAEGGQAVHEWEIAAADYRIAAHGGFGEVTISLDGPGTRSRQEIPSRCDDCIRTAGVSLSIRNAFDGEEISFKLNDPDDVLPSPFPVFGSWTKFREDEVIH